MSPRRPKTAANPGRSKVTPAARKTETETRERRCIATGVVRPCDGMIRFVLDPEGQVVPDLEGKLPGRGLWVTASRKALADAVKRNAFAKAAKTAAKAAPGLPEQVTELLRRRVLDLFGLARRGGYVIVGFGNVEAALGDEKIAPALGALIEAEDGADDGRRKLAAAMRRSGLEIPVIIGPKASEMGLALGRELVVHAALRGGALTRKLMVELARLRGMKDVDGGQR